MVYQNKNSTNYEIAIGCRLKNLVKKGIKIITQTIAVLKIVYLTVYVYVMLCKAASGLKP